MKKAFASSKGKNTISALMDTLTTRNEKDDFTDEEYKFLKKLANKKGKIYPNTKEFLKALEKL